MLDDRIASGSGAAVVGGTRRFLLLCLIELLTVLDVLRWKRSRWWGFIYWRLVNW